MYILKYYFSQILSMKKRVTFVCDEELWTELRKKALDERKTYSEMMEGLINKKIGKVKK